MAAEHGTRSRYNSGCRCAACKQAERDYQAARKQARNVEKATGAEKVSPVAVLKDQRRPKASRETAQHSQPASEYGAVEAAIREQLGALSTVESRPGEAEMAYALARMLDNPRALGQHPQAAARLSELVDKLRKGADKKTGKLAAVRRMSRGPESATG